MSSSTPLGWAAAFSPDAGAATPVVNKPATSSPTETTENRDVRKAKLLVVDDEPVNLLLAQKCLQAAGYESIVTTSDSQGVIQMIERESPDVVLLDIIMPIRSGLEILEEIRATPHLSKLPVIILTATDDDQVRTQALELGATDLLSKPIRPTELLPRVRNAILLKLHHDDLRRYTQELERQVRCRTAELAASRLELIYCLARIAEYRDNETGRHVIRVGLYSGIIARQLGLDQATVELIEAAAPLHDIGKIGVPDSILLKPDKLSPEEAHLMQRHVALGKRAFEPMSASEWKAFRSHTLVGEMIMNLPSSPLISMASQIALTHHERWDGTGYPLGLAGEDIPLPGRIVAVADVFDALSSRRPYRAAVPMNECFALLAEQRGLHFEPRIIDAFLSAKEEIVKIRIEYADID